MPAAPDQQLYRAVMASFPTGVTVVTAMTPDGPVGMTANAMCSLSLEPLLLLVCFDNTSRTLPLIRDAGRYAVNLLSVAQDELSRRFASREIPELQKFDGVAHRIADGLPAIDGAVAWVACELEAMHPGGDHTIGVGAVRAIEMEDSREPLVWFRGSYGALGT